ncbi:hypothetical protein Pyn_33963 [Prunus yedoensis var. nudiflora]|uniref:Uncharacterized protein n=1 Tax=Prunus yedoensis var. nudiflora TaxID=2094558 RepID=A0A314YF90_PRUYE|nr:hypothetical protein Pyn_33963 [Prunus yedoensis var. nudiflora]
MRKGYAPNHARLRPLTLTDSERKSQQKALSVPHPPTQLSTVLRIERLTLPATPVHCFAICFLLIWIPTSSLVAGASAAVDSGAGKLPACPSYVSSSGLVALLHCSFWTASNLSKPHKPSLEIPV